MPSEEEEEKHAPAAEKTPWQRVQNARHPKRPHTLDYVPRILTDFQEIHGDRLFGDDPAIVCGMGRLDGQPVLLIGEQKGRDTKQKLYRNFGMPKPEGYRKAIRVMQLAAKFNRPIITLLDTPGAYPGIDARVSARRIDQRDDGPVELGRNLHRAQRLAVSLRLRHPKVPEDLLLGVAAFLLRHDHHRSALEPGHSCDNRRVVPKHPVAMDFLEIGAEPLDIVQRMRPLRMAR